MDRLENIIYGARFDHSAAAAIKVAAVKAAVKTTTAYNSIQATSTAAAVEQQ